MKSFKKRLIWGILLAPFVMAAAVALVFNVFYYPIHGLEGISQDNCQEALLRVGSAYAASESLSLSDLVSFQYWRLDPQQAYAWGTILLRTPQGEEVYLWAYLGWSSFWKRWQRLKVSRLADPRDRLLLVESLHANGNLRRAGYMLDNWRREGKRRFREVWH